MTDINLFFICPNVGVIYYFPIIFEWTRHAAVFVACGQLIGNFLLFALAIGAFVVIVIVHGTGEN